jgi:hypothetical protein
LVVDVDIPSLEDDQLNPESTLRKTPVAVAR